LHIEKEIENALKSYLDAFNNMHWQELEALLADDFTYFTDKCIKQNKSEYISFMSTNPWCGKDYSINNLKIISGNTPDIAISSYDSTFDGTYKDKPSRVEAVETTVFKKINGKWLLVHSHTSNK
jgi:ketosteroid isomerase-like protein